MPGDTRPENQQARPSNIRAPEELSEHEESKDGMPAPAKIDTGNVEVSKRSVNIALGYTMGASALCVGAVMVDPNHVVEGVALAVLASSFGFAKSLVLGRNRKSKTEI